MTGWTQSIDKGGAQASSRHGRAGMLALQFQRRPLNHESHFPLAHI
jgi:hypothetical protein